MGSVSGSVSERKPAISVPMREGTPAASTKSGATLVELERQLEGALIEYEHLCQAWPEESHVLSWSEAGREMEAALVRIDELQYAIATSPARTLPDAAVQLRRLGALLDGQDPARRLLVSALAVVETAVDADDARVDGPGDEVGSHGARDEGHDQGNGQASARGVMLPPCRLETKMR